MSAPKADEWTKRKCHEDAIDRSQLGYIEHMLPCVDPPFPIFLRVLNDKWFSRRAARSMKPLVMVVGPSVIATESHRILFGKQFRLPRSGQSIPIFPTRYGPKRGELVSVKGIVPSRVREGF